jgi:5-methylcytosine-specific restriction endonuclease McrA
MDQCDHSKKAVRVKIQSNGVKNFRWQCLICFENAGCLSFAEAKKHLNGSPEESWDQDSLDEYRKARVERDRDEYLRRREENRDEWFRKYNEHLSSPEWQRKREFVLKRDNYLCQACLRAKATQVHHLSYRFYNLVGSEPAFDLISICDRCHAWIHPHMNASSGVNLSFIEGMQ